MYMHRAQICKPSISFNNISSQNISILLQHTLHVKRNKIIFCSSKTISIQNHAIPKRE